MHVIPMMPGLDDRPQLPSDVDAAAAATAAIRYPDSFFREPDDDGALRAWRAQCPELQELWDESAPVTAWEGLTIGEAGGTYGVTYGGAVLTPIGGAVQVEQRLTPSSTVDPALGFSA